MTDGRILPIKLYLKQIENECFVAQASLPRFKMTYHDLVVPVIWTGIGCMQSRSRVLTQNRLSKPVEPTRAPNCLLLPKLDCRDQPFLSERTSSLSAQDFWSNHEKCCADFCIRCLPMMIRKKIGEVCNYRPFQRELFDAPSIVW